MADLTAEQAIEKLRALPEDKQRDVLLKLDPTVRSGILDSLRSGTSKNLTLGQRYHAARTAGTLPKKEVLTIGGSGPAAALGQVGQEAGELAQQYQNAATPGQFRQGKQVDDRSLLDQAGNALASGTFETLGVGAKLASGLSDWKTGAAMLVGKLNPALSAAFFATQGSKQAYDALQSGDRSPENVQNFLLGLATVSGAMGAVGEKSYTPAEMKAKALALKEGIKTGVKTGVHDLSRGVTESRVGVKKGVEQAIGGQEEALASNRVKRAGVLWENLETTREKNMEIDRGKQAIADKNKTIEENNRAQAEQVARRGELTNQIDQQSMDLGTKIRDVEQKVGEEGNRKFEAIKQKIGVTDTAPSTSPEPLITAVKVAENSILQRIPENVKEFRSIMALGGESEEMSELRSQVMQGQNMAGNYEDLSPERKGLVDDIAAKYGGEVTQGQPATWNKLQALKTRLDAKMRSRSVSPIMKQALGQVRDAVVDSMGSMAEAKGAGADWQDARNFYRQWREDFHTPTGPSGSGSPVAQAFDAVDARNIRQPFIRTDATTGNRGVETLRKYGDFGGNEAADSVTRIMSGREERAGLPAAENPAALKPTPESYQMPEHKPAPPIPGKPTVDIEQIAKDKIRDTASRVGRLNAWDARILIGSAIAPLVAPFLGWKGGMEIGSGYVMTKMALARSLENPRVAEWIAKTPPAELNSLRQLPGIDKVNVVQGMTKAFSDAKVTKISPELQQFLGPENVARILAASTANRPAVQNRKDALQVLGK